LFETIRNAWRIDTLRKKILFTILIIALYRVGSMVYLPLIDPAAVSTASVGAFDVLNAITGGNLGQVTVFALGVQPYINSSIIIQLLTVVIPALERMAKEGEEGKKKMNRITKYVTMGLSLMMAIGYYVGYVQNILVFTSGPMAVLSAVVIIAVMVAGANLVVWLGEEITLKGIGNGISILIFAGIMARFPSILYSLFVEYFYNQGIRQGNVKFIIGAPIMFVLYIVMIAFIVYITDAERRVPVQYAKRVVGRKVYGGQSSYYPFKVNMSGVLPVIFASSFMSIPTIINIFVQSTEGVLYNILNFFRSNSIQYAVIYFFLILGFNFFYATIQQNPVEMANQLRKNNGAIPGIRPGKPTADFLKRIISKINVLGGLFLGIVAVAPIILGLILGMNFSMAGTSIIIVVGVCLETVKSMESQMMMRHYKGFLE